MGEFKKYTKNEKYEISIPGFFLLHIGVENYKPLFKEPWEIAIIPLADIQYGCYNKKPYIHLPVVNVIKKGRNNDKKFKIFCFDTDAIDFFKSLHKRGLPLILTQLASDIGNLKELQKKVLPKDWVNNKISMYIDDEDDF